MYREEATAEIQSDFQDVKEVFWEKKSGYAEGETYYINEIREESCNREIKAHWRFVE